MVVTRFAPSPTGSLHIGGIRTALFAYALARRHNGRFFLRIEDTDQNRFVEGAEAEIEEMLDIYGLSYDEKFKQSERLEVYKQEAEKLIEQGDAYYCFATKQEIDEMRAKAQEQKKTFIFRSPYRDMPLAEARTRIANGEKYVIRQKLPENHVVVFDDGVQGKMSFNTNDIDETVLLKSDGFPTYHLAVVVDDHLMGVTHVFRGVEWLPSVPKHVMLYRAFGYTMPVIAHLPVILDPDGGKLSKRKGSVSARGFLEEGYLPEAVLNFLMLLGWSAPLNYEHGEKERELFSLQEFVDLFDMKDVNKASPVFNREKLIWFNQKYIQSLTPDLLTLKFSNWLQKYGKDEQLKDMIIKGGPDYLQKILTLEQSRTHIFSELEQLLPPFYRHEGKANLLDSKQTKNMELDTIKQFLKDMALFIESHTLDKISHELWESFVREYADKRELKAGALFMSLRLAVLETPFSPPLFEVMGILGEKEVLNRIRKYI